MIRAMKYCVIGVFVCLIRWKMLRQKRISLHNIHK